MSQLRKTHIVLVNGPPGAGKDTFANELLGVLRQSFPAADAFIDRFAAPINDAIIAGHKLTPIAYATLERGKNHPSPLLAGRSLREARIQLGEHYFKPLYGRTVFGKLLLERIGRRDITPEPIICIVPDLGFEEETTPLIQSPAELSVVRIEREGATYAKDSRSFVDTLGIHEHIHNDAGIDHLTGIARRLVDTRLRPWARGFTL